MTRKIIIIVSFLLCCFMAVIVKENQPVSAYGTTKYPNLIKGWKVTGDNLEYGWTQAVTDAGGAAFKVTIEWGSDCKDDDETMCSVTSKFRCYDDGNAMHYWYDDSDACQSRGAPWNPSLTCGGKSATIDISKNSEKDGYVYYDATITPWNYTGNNNSSHQRIHFQFKRKAVVKKTLRVDIKDHYTGQVIKPGFDSDTVDKGSEAEVDASWKGAKDEGYYWYQWGSSCPSDNQNGKKCKYKSLTTNKVVYAHYWKMFQAELYAADIVTGTLLNNENAIATSGLVWQGKSASVTANYSFENYHWWGWDDASCPIANRNDKTCTFDKLTERTLVYAYYRRKFNVTAYAVDLTTGALLNGGNPIDATSQWQGLGGSITSNNYNPTGYSFVKWIGGLCDNQTDRTCTTASTDADATVYAYYILDRFEGQTGVSGAASDATDWATVDGGKTKSTTISNCGGGCKVKFTHNMKSASGYSGSTTYTIHRKSNSPNISTGQITSGTFTGSTSKAVRTSGEYTLYPGTIVCETLKFSAEPATGKSSYSSYCVYAEAPADGLSINLQVRNTSAAATYHDWQDEVYGKPGDIIDFRSSYTPSVQTFADYTADVINGQAQSSPTPLKNFNKWNNGYNVSSNRSSLAYTKSGTIGNTDTLSVTKNYNKVVANDVGKSITETFLVNNKIVNVPSKVTFSVQEGENPKITATITWADKTKTVYARIPYNFVTTSEVVTPGIGEEKPTPVESGERVSIIAKTGIKEKSNSVTTEDGGKYATRADSVLQKLIIYNSDATGGKRPGGVASGGRTADLCSTYFGHSNDEQNCGYSDTITSASMNPGDQSHTFNINIKDVAAGTQVCVALAVFPATSGADTNVTDTNYSNSWRVSESKCYQVAKRPSIQVWGGNIFSSGEIVASRSIKNNLNGYSGYNIRSGQGVYIFGSFGELGLIAAKGAKGFASGSSLGYATNNNGNLSPQPLASVLSFTPNTPSNTPNPGGSTTSNFCAHSVLTFGNSGCASGTTSGTGASDATSGIDLDLASIESLASVDTRRSEVAGTVYINGGTDGGDGVLLYHGNNDLEVTGGTIARSALKIVSAPNITITGNISVAEDTIFRFLSQVPKAVIYATGTNGTVKIDCNVTRLDALIVADTVITCNNLDESVSGIESQIVKRINDSANSHQLIVNGAIVAKRLYANRTYGAAAGANSIVPAEIINFDPTLYLWGGAAGGSTDDDTAVNTNMETTYIHELAPRF